MTDDSDNGNSEQPTYYLSFRLGSNPTVTTNCQLCQTLIIMKLSIEEFIQTKLTVIERTLNDLKSLIANAGTDMTSTADLQEKLKAANDRIRQLEYEKWFNDMKNKRTNKNK